MASRVTWTSRRQAEARKLKLIPVHAKTTSSHVEIVVDKHTQEIEAIDTCMLAPSLVKQVLQATGSQNKATNTVHTTKWT